MTVSFCRAAVGRILITVLNVVLLGTVVRAAEGEPVKEKVYQLQELDQFPTARVQTKPIYPTKLRAAKVEGKALISFVVSPNGTVLRTEVMEATEPEFGEAAAVAVSQWVFRPGKLKGESVSTALKVPVIFNIQPETVPPQSAAAVDRPVSGPVINFREADEQPKLVSQVNPIYPPALRLQGITGVAVVGMVIDREGIPCRVRVVGQATEDAFGEAAVQAVRCWRFRPGEKDGKPVNIAMQIPVQFALSHD